MDTTKITNDIGVLNRALKTAATAALKDKIKAKVSKLKKILADAKIPTQKLATMLLGAKRRAQGYSAKEFGEVIERLAARDEYHFLKGMSKGKIKDDLKREAKKPGWRFKGRDNFKTPTTTDIKNRFKTGKVYMETRTNRSDVVKPAKLKTGGALNNIKVGDRIKDKYNIEGEVYFSDGNVIKVEYPSGATFTYTKKDFDNGEVRFLWSDRDIYKTGGNLEKQWLVEDEDGKRRVVLSKTKPKVGNTYKKADWEGGHEKVKVTRFISKSVDKLAKGKKIPAKKEEPVNKGSVVGEIPTQKGDIVSIKNPLADEDPDQLYVVTQDFIEEYSDNDQILCTALGTGMTFAPTSAIEKKDLMVVVPATKVQDAFAWYKEQKALYPDRYAKGGTFKQRTISGHTQRIPKAQYERIEAEYSNLKLAHGATIGDVIDRQMELSNICHKHNCTVSSYHEAKKKYGTGGTADSADDADAPMLGGTMASSMRTGGTSDEEEVDLFEDYESLPPQVVQIIDKYADADQTYETMREMQAEMEAVGYTFDYGLDAQPFGLKKMKNGGNIEYYKELIKADKARLKNTHGAEAEFVLENLAYNQKMLRQERKKLKTPKRPRWKNGGAVGEWGYTLMYWGTASDPIKHKPDIFEDYDTFDKAKDGIKDLKNKTSFNKAIILDPKGKEVWSSGNAVVYGNGGGTNTCETFDANGERAIDPKSIEKLTECTENQVQTKVLNTDKNGNYTPDRIALHKKIIRHFKKDVVCITKGRPIAVLMGGAPASGKSTFLKKYRPYLLSDSIFKVDADEIRAELPEYKGWNATQTHEETGDIVNTLISNRTIGVPCLFDFIYDGTMTNYKKYDALIEMLKGLGYDIYIVFISNIPRETLVKRALERYKKSGRFVPVRVIDDFLERGEKSMEQLKRSVTGYIVVDGSSDNYKILERGGKQLPNDRLYEKLGEKIKLKKGGGIDAEQLLAEQRYPASKGWKNPAGSKKEFVQKKVSKVMKEFNAGTLKTSHGEKVTDEAQALAIGYSEGNVGWKHKKK